MGVRRFVLTGAPGAGKTTVIEELGRRGWPVVAEAATEVNVRAHAAGVDQPWTAETFLRDIVELQCSRQRAATGEVIFFDRSPLCTLALARYLDQPVPDVLSDAVEELAGSYERQVFLLQPLGFVERTVVRRISYADSLRFAAIHEDVYTEHGFTLVAVPRAPVPDRVALIERVVQSSSGAAAT